MFGDMAQLVERYVRNVQATSSNLVISTTRYPVELICQRQRVLAGYFLFWFKIAVVFLIYHIAL